MFDRISEGRWWDIGLQLVEGCTKVSPGCDNCWSLSAANMRRFNPNPKIAARYEDTVTHWIHREEGERPNWTGKVNLQWQDLDKIGKGRKPQVYTFWNDLFHEGVEEKFIDEVMVRIIQRRDHFYIACTKRPERALKYFSSRYPMAFDNRLMLMTTTENQEQADLRVPILLQTPGVLHGLSVEPMLGPIEIHKGWIWEPYHAHDYPFIKPRLHWVIAGPETGPHRRSADIAWFNSFLGQAESAGVPYFQKALELDTKISKKMEEWPRYIRIRQVPHV